MILCISTVYFTRPLYYFGIFCLLQAWITATIHSDAIDAIDAIDANNANDPTRLGLVPPAGSKRGLHRGGHGPAKVGTTCFWAGTPSKTRPTPCGHSLH